MQKKYPDQLGSRSPVIKRVDGKKGVSYRAMVGPFASREEATRFCAATRPQAASAGCPDRIDPKEKAAVSLTLSRGRGLIGRMAQAAFITGISGTTLTADERDFIAPSGPGASSCSGGTSITPPKSLRWLREMREVLGEPDAPVLVDQEGGRVQRFRPPHWPLYPAGAAFGQLYDIESAAGIAGRPASAPG